MAHTYQTRGLAEGEILEGFCAECCAVHPIQARLESGPSHHPYFACVEPAHPHRNRPQDTQNEHTSGTSTGTLAACRSSTAVDAGKHQAVARGEHSTLRCMDAAAAMSASIGTLWYSALAVLLQQPLLFLFFRGLHLALLHLLGCIPEFSDP
jgi:hypothetical protein